MLDVWLYLMITFGGETDEVLLERSSKKDRARENNNNSNRRRGNDGE